MFRFLNARLISSLETQVSVLKAETSRLHSTSAGLRIDLNKTRGEVSQRDDYIGSLRNDRMSAMQRISSLQRDLTDSRNVAFKLRQQVAEQDEEIEELEEELDAAEAANDCLLERNLQLSNAVTQLSYEVMFQPTRVTATEASLRKQLAMQKLNEGGLREQLDDRNDLITALKTEVESLKKQRTALVKERDELKEENKQEALDKANLNHELANASRHLRQITATFGWALPIPVKALQDGKDYYNRLIYRRPYLAPSRGQPHAKAA